jgi:hypothetical protein
MEYYRKVLIADRIPPVDMYGKTALRVIDGNGLHDNRLMAIINSRLIEFSTRDNPVCELLLQNLVDTGRLELHITAATDATDLSLIFILMAFRMKMYAYLTKDQYDEFIACKMVAPFSI